MVSPPSVPVRYKQPGGTHASSLRGWWDMGKQVGVVRVPWQPCKARFTVLWESCTLPDGRSFKGAVSDHLQAVWKKGKPRSHH